MSFEKRYILFYSLLTPETMQIWEHNLYWMCLDKEASASKKRTNKARLSVFRAVSSIDTRSGLQESLRERLL